MKNEFCGLYLESAFSLIGSAYSLSPVSFERGISVSKVAVDDGEVYLLKLASELSFDENLKERLGAEIAKTLTFFLKKHKIKRSSHILVAGIGNEGMTADSLGGEVLKRLKVTEHLYQAGVKERGDGRLSAIAGSVAGVTGINSFDVIKGVVDRTKPDLVIAVDTLATRHAERLKNTVQITDNGIIPGSGVQNARHPLTLETLGVPVIAIGVPLVIYARNLITSGLSDVKLGELANKETPRGKSLEELNDLIVTVKEIDLVVDEYATAIASGINSAVHER